MKSFLWMLGSMLSFSLMAISVRELSGHIGTLQILFFRSAISLFVIIIIIIILDKPLLFYTQRLRLHTLRNSFHFAAQYGWFIGLMLLPLAQVIALEFTVPFWTAMIAWLFLKEHLKPKKLLSIFLGFIGVLIIVKPSSDIFNSASLIVLIAAVFFAVSHTSTKSLSTTEHPITVLFYMCLIQLPIAFICSITHWNTPNIFEWIWLTTVGLSGLSAHYCMTKAMQYSDVSTVVSLDLLRLPFIALLGIFLYNERLDIALIIGCIIIISANLLNLYTPTNHSKNR